MAIPKKKFTLPFFTLLLVNLWSNQMVIMAMESIPIGVVLDLNSTVGEMAESCMSMAVSDFYALNVDFKTRLALFTRDSSSDVVAATSSVLDLMKKQVHAIIGPQKSSQAKFVIELGGKAEVPIVSFSATSPTLSATQSKYFVRTVQDDSSQVKAIASIVQAYGWREIVLIYEDTEYGNGLVPLLLEAFQEIDTRVPYGSRIPLYFNDTQIMRELSKLKAMQKSIFLVHMSASLGSRLFLLAKDAGMMSEGYAWLVTAGLSTLLDPLGSEVMDSMRGVLGIKPHVPTSKKLESFKSRWRKNFTISKPQSKINELNLFGLWAYDTVWAIAMAVEKAGIVHSRYVKPNTSEGTVDIAALGKSETGPRLLSSILSTRFQGLSGDFHLAGGERVPSAFEILNLIGKAERVIGYWTPERGLSRNLYTNGKIASSTSKNRLKEPIWPGDTTQQPKRLRIGVPLKTGFNEFIEVEWNPEDDKPIVSGFTRDVFVSVVEALPFPLPYEFIPFVNKNKQSAGTYNDLLDQIKLKNFDAAVGDITIIANRSTYVDFTLPFSESGITMVVLTKRDERENMWIFLKPLSLELWLTTGIAFILTGLVVWVLEHRENKVFRGKPAQQLGTTLWFSFSTLFFAHREKVVNNWTRFVLIIWIFVVLIISQSYTASLASILTVKRLQPTFVDVKEIRKNGYFVGHQKDSFVKDFLVKQLNFNDTMLREYSTPEEYHDALSRGTHNGGVAAIFAEIPYIKLFLAKYCSKFQMVGPTYKTDGFGFAFPLGSPLVPYISRAILNVTQDKDKMDEIERRNFGGETTCSDQAAMVPSGGLGLPSFGGLFIITGVASMSALLIYVTKFLYIHWPASNTMDQERSFYLRVLELAKHFDKEDPSAHHLNGAGSRVHAVPSVEIVGASPDIDDARSHSRTSSEGSGDIIGDQDHDNHTPRNSAANPEPPHTP
ncbi:hypothetical protein POPTR_018G096500v4 [Populus trichocarpa]|uniref:Glutamate receptor n=1 Tax=Populus trichocarpa TaxID=3694 RepID=A0A2K1WYJ4_POPTR|nr:glutamate receptor 2.8 isoform X2 [Populus trichocarpa]PNS93601.2 hypothetical protein POPTR_018G096500v4 [Populus trichocarpa]|eukprot:XP_024445715.1 glutamate receptor 2.8 [Populus trichocarpa]